MWKGNSIGQKNELSHFRVVLGQNEF
jgi:hypothetical protein